MTENGRLKTKSEHFLFATPLRSGGKCLLYRSRCSHTRALSSAFEDGFSLFELIVVISIVAVLASVFLTRVLYYQEQAEKTAMVEVVGAIQTALILQYGEVMTRGKASDLAWLKNDNPMNWLQQKPRNYAGEFYDPTPPSVESGNWVFDLKSHDLIYVLNVTNNFKPGKDGKNWIRYHVSIKYEPSRLPSLQDAPPELTGLQFEPVEPYSWF
ncbi:MAG: type II secretion system protein [Gallionella sp.]|nr:type II secretion system protein [Gallionella sp.]